MSPSIYSLPVASLSKNLRWSRLERLFFFFFSSHLRLVCPVLWFCGGGFLVCFFFFFFSSFCGLITEASGVKVKWCN